MDIKKSLDESARCIMNTYARFPVVFRKGRGMRVWSADGKEYLDFVAGVAVNILGHCHPRIVVAIQKQAQRLIHVSNYFHVEPQIKLAKMLVEHTFADKVFFCNSGAEAIEASIKLARKYSVEQVHPDRFEIIAAHNSFHGRTLGALTATGQEKFQRGFGPLVPGFRHVPFDDVGALRETVSEKTCAILLEPVQGEGGVRIPADDYLREVRSLCDETKALLILDEVQTGMGRTGRLFAHEHAGIAPDIMATAKGLGGGVPIGAMLSTEKVAAAFQPGSHASTFGGNPLVCAAGVATLDVVLEDGFVLDQCRRMGAYFLERLELVRTQFPELVRGVRGRGLMIGLELAVEGDAVVRACFEKGFLINCTAGNVLRFIPPLIVQRKDIDNLTDALREILSGMA